MVEDGFSSSGGQSFWLFQLGPGLGDVSCLGQERIALHELYLHGDEEWAFTWVQE